MYWNDDDNSPEKRAGIIIFIIFMLLMASLAILGNHSRAFAKRLSTERPPGVYSDESSMCHVAEEQESEEDKMVSEISNAIRNNLIMCRQGSDGKILFHLFCREDELCLDSIKEYARYIVKYSLEFNVDPWLAASVAMHETNFNAFVKGSRGERSIFQLLPYSPWGEKSYFTQNAKYRDKCKSQIGHCQEESVGLAIQLLSNAMKECRTVAGTLSMYNGGECRKSSTKKYIKGVKEKMHTLKTKHVSVQWCSGGII